VKLDTLIAIFSSFGIHFQATHSWDNLNAVDVEKDRVAVSIADDLVSGSIGYAPPFECDRVREMYGLCCGSLRSPEGYFQPEEGNFFSGSHRPAGASFRKTAPPGIFSQRSSPSSSLGLRRIERR
jgi:hypothetical protein